MKFNVGDRVRVLSKDFYLHETGVIHSVANTTPFDVGYFVLLDDQPPLQGGYRLLRRQGAYRYAQLFDETELEVENG